jgi:hypothetical protein
VLELVAGGDPVRLSSGGVRRLATATLKDEEIDGHVEHDHEATQRALELAGERSRVQNRKEVALECSVAGSRRPLHSGARPP